MEPLATERERVNAGDRPAEREMRGTRSLFVCTPITLKPLKTLLLSSRFNQTRHTVTTAKGVNKAPPTLEIQMHSRLPVM